MSSSAAGNVSVSSTAARPARNRVGHGVVFFYTMAIVYASLNPFFGWRAPESYGLFVWPRHLIAFDIVLNVIAYIPLGGMLAAMRIRAPLQTGHRRSALDVLTRVAVTGFMLSVIMESLQTMLPVRVSSPVDLIANTAGTLLGAMVPITRWGRALLARVLNWRHRHFAPGDECGWGLLLLATWFVAQLNPVIPFFEAGHIANPVDVSVLSSATTPYDQPLILLPQAVGITLNVCGFALFVSLLMRPEKRAAVSVLVILALGFFAKISAASLMLKTPQLVAWLGPATIIGLSAGLLLFVFFSRIRYRWRAFAATLFIFAGGLMAKMSSIYSPFDATLRLFSWPHGHLISFASLTRWIHESWPLLACLLVAWIFVRQREPHA